ncbi:MULTISPECIES: ABC transporter permease [unclassified Streptomyces]|jgi:peptide/nickel transport system permease protein|uniref:ABC transporter permease n=1 Tax=unclassified Streptomyces TaxID=2593676 RepID=UPI00277D7433|nr:ABC transporter permease [Streptomyces sp. V1I6]MDQ0845440.1 peptide/nickel transport system permease protein [Streptomyces sp. V1I6]
MTTTPTPPTKTTPAAPAGPVGKSAPTARSLTWARRRHSVARFWSSYRTHRAGLFGLAALALIALTALAAPLLVGGDVQSVTNAPGTAMEKPSGEFPLGTDQFGRSLLGLLVWGARISLTVGLLAAALSVAIGTLVGIIAGHYGGWFSTVLMRITDWFLVMPALVLAIVLATVMSRNVWTVIIAIGITSWPTTARLVRAQTIAVESRPYIERAKALGGGHGHIMNRHVLPNVMPLVLAQTTLGISSAILTEATLAFLGLGDPTVVSWGGMLQDAREAGAVSSGHWWYLAPPGIAIALVALAFTLCGRAIESVLNPKLGVAR